jgi:hypothetical protein
LLLFPALTTTTKRLSMATLIAVTRATASLLMSPPSSQERSKTLRSGLSMSC